MTKHVIELNGLKYDATTGKPVSVTSTPAASKIPSGPRHLDGFSRRPGTVKQPHVVSKTIHASTQKSQTLMRKAVAKPVAPTKIHSQVGGVSAKTANTSHQTRIEAVKPGRAIRATHISQSNLISKFGKTPPNIQSKVVPVKPAPTPPVAASHTTKPVSVSHVTHPTLVKSAPQSKKESVFQNAIANATSHQTTRLKKPRIHHRIARKLHVSPRLVTFSGMTLAVLAVGSILAYQNMPEIAMKVASARAGLSASLPAYQPSGFSLAGPIKYDSGEVTLNYKSHSDNRAFNVVQKNSSWNSETLLENFVASTKQPYQTFQANGRTIYIYEGNKATWVDGGVWFNIDGEANLNSDQLLKIADSL